MKNSELQLKSVSKKLAVGAFILIVYQTRPKFGKITKGDFVFLRRRDCVDERLAREISYKVIIMIHCKPRWVLRIF